MHLDNFELITCPSCGRANEPEELAPAGFTMSPSGTCHISMTWQAMCWNCEAPLKVSATLDLKDGQGSCCITSVRPMPTPADISYCREFGILSPD
jgi:hypothetical protein